MSLLSGVLNGDWRAFVSTHADAVEEELRSCEMLGDCETATDVWARQLKTAGFQGCRVEGAWRYEDVQVPHWWLYVEGDFFDPTASQFLELEGVPANAGEYVEKRRICW